VFRHAYHQGSHRPRPFLLGSDCRTYELMHLTYLWQNWLTRIKDTQRLSRKTAEIPRHWRETAPSLYRQRMVRLLLEQDGLKCL